MRLYPELEAALKAWIARQPDPKHVLSMVEGPFRADALRRLVEKGLEAEGSRQCPEDAK